MRASTCYLTQQNYTTLQTKTPNHYTTNDTAFVQVEWAMTFDLPSSTGYPFITILQQIQCTEYANKRIYCPWKLWHHWSKMAVVEAAFVEYEKVHCMCGYHLYKDFQVATAGKKH